MTNPDNLRRRDVLNVIDAALIGRRASKETMTVEESLQVLRELFAEMDGPPSPDRRVRALDDDTLRDEISRVAGCQRGSERTTRLVEWYKSNIVESPPGVRGTGDAK